MQGQIAQEDPPLGVWFVRDRHIVRFERRLGTRNGVEAQSWAYHLLKELDGAIRSVGRSLWLQDDERP